MRDCTIDVWVLRTIRCGGDRYHPCAFFLETIWDSRCRVCIDDEQVISQSYDKLVDYKNASDLITRWWKFIQLKRLKCVRPKLTTTLRHELSKLGFHNDDLIYIGTANASTDRKIISGDSDFGCNPGSKKNRRDIKDYLDKSHSIITLTPHEAAKELIREMGMVNSPSHSETASV